MGAQAFRFAYVHHLASYAVAMAAPHIEFVSNAFSKPAAHHYIKLALPGGIGYAFNSSLPIARAAIATITGCNVCSAVQPSERWCVWIYSRHKAASSMAQEVT